MLLLEHKSPCVLEPSDWAEGIENGIGASYRNAAIISKQVRKYMAAGDLNMIAIYDSCVVGVSLNGKTIRSGRQRSWMGKYFSKTAVICFNCVDHDGLGSEGVYLIET